MKAEKKMDTASLEAMQRLRHEIERHGYKVVYQPYCDGAGIRGATNRRTKTVLIVRGAHSSYRQIVKTLKRELMHVEDDRKEGRK